MQNVDVREHEIDPTDVRRCLYGWCPARLSFSDDPDRSTEITECEGHNCSITASSAVTWTFRGLIGTGAFGTGRQPLTIEHFDKGQIVVSRIDTTGPWRGSARYTGRIAGDQINGTVLYFDPGHQNTPRTDVWYGIIGHPVASAAPPPAAANRTPLTPAEQSRITEICSARQTRHAMQSIEDQSIRDPNGAMLAMLACGVTSVCPSSTGTARILDSKTGNDGGKYTSADPGSFVCRALFLHQGIKIDLADDADAGSELTAQQITNLMNSNPTFIEWFKIKPLANGNLKLTLIPTSLQLSREYATEYTYP